MHNATVCSVVDYPGWDENPSTVVLAATLICAMTFDRGTHPTIQPRRVLRSIVRVGMNARASVVLASTTALAIMFDRGTHPTCEGHR